MPVYLDCAATTPIIPEVREEILKYLDDDFGNAVAAHPPDRDDARDTIPSPLSGCDVGVSSSCKHES